MLLDHKFSQTMFHSRTVKTIFVYRNSFFRVIEVLELKEEISYFACIFIQWSPVYWVHNVRYILRLLGRETQTFSRVVTMMRIYGILFTDIYHVFNCLKILSQVKMILVGIINKKQFCKTKNDQLDVSMFRSSLYLTIITSRLNKQNNCTKKIRFLACKIFERRVFYHYGNSSKMCEFIIKL